MGRRYREVGIMLVMLVSVGRCDLAKDKEECANQLVGLATCLPYVGGEAKTPTIDCCTGLNQVMKNNLKCLCILVRDRNDPSLGLKINATLALGLPAKCNSPTHDVSGCPALLHLAPNSPESKVFTDFDKAAAAPPGSNASTPTPMDSSTGTSISKVPTNGGLASTNGLIPQMFYGVVFTFYFII
ncbi:hypothetical protein RND81_04G247000 [Saponaria officinalis]|uniref:Bifunctional inhibitor/plant lipid transfer protein/seed storage helical domain-containing protein n=1 Tax=Saponaria officinalis TaxID=3572 RepID=A0AAW1LHC3_SAPOF